MSRKLFALAFAVMILCLLPAHARAALKIGVLPASDSLALHVVNTEGIFKEHGLDVELIPFQSALEQGAAVRAGALHGWFTDIIAVMLMNESGVPQHIIATMSYSGPGSRFFGIAAAPGSQAAGPDDLKGGTIAISQATIIEFMLDTMLEAKGLSRETVERVDIKQISVRLQLLLAGKIDAALLPEPLLSLMEARGARVILDNTGLSLPLAITALRRGAVTPEQISAFQAALAEAMRRINANPEAYRQVMLEARLLPRDASPKYRMLRYDPAHTPLPLPTERELEHAARWMLKVRLLRDMPAVGDMLYAPDRR